MSNSASRRPNASKQPLGRISGFSLAKWESIIHDVLKLHAFATSQVSDVCALLESDLDINLVQRLVERVGLDWSLFLEMVKIGHDKDHPSHELAHDWELAPTALGRARVRVITPEEACATQYR